MVNLIAAALACFIVAAVFVHFWRKTPAEKLYETAESGPVRVRTALMACALGLTIFGLHLLWLALTAVQ